MTKRKSHEERRVEIAQTALKLAAEVGASNVSAQAIADAMGVSQATVFRHFATRDAVFREAIAEIRRSVHAALGPIFEDKTTSAAERLKRLAVAHLGFVQDNRGIPALLFSDGLHAGDATLKADVRELMKSFAGRVAALVMEGVKDGSIDVGVDPALIGQAFVTLVQGAALRWMLFDRSFDLKSQADVIWALVKPALSAQNNSTPLK
ncbi:MAG: TetR/AcrR family transcriptional regulator [Rhodospirillales bacterium]|nr:TetR/AcrR family transcriptional regulator [Rhodospirillales bacterium]